MPTINMAIIAIVIGLTSTAAADGGFKVPSFIASNMVLQRRNATVWGWGTPGDSVHVAVEAPAGTVLSSSMTQVNVTGEWSVSLKVNATASTTVTLVSGGSSIVLTNVAFGDVFLCSGQSNMEYPMADAFYGTKEREESSFSNLRMLNLADIQNIEPQQDCPSKAPYIWAASAPDTISVRNGSLGDGPTDFSDKYPSAVCWFTARDLLAVRPSIPIGIITAAKSGSPIEAWMTPAALIDGTPASLGGNGTCGGSITPLPNASHVRNSTCPKGGLSKGGEFFKGMIAPLLKMRLSGIWWYQGEENDHADDACPGPVWYKCLFPAMIQYWRSSFSSPTLPFFYVLLAGGHTAVMREAQQEGGSAVAHTAFASAVDLSAATSEYLVPGHPPRKQEVGRRLSLAVRDLVYHDNVDYVGPVVVNVSVVQDHSSNGGIHTTVIINFNVGANGYLHLNGTGGCTQCCNGTNLTSSFSNPVSPVSLIDPDAAVPPGTLPRVSKTETFSIDQSNARMIATIPGWTSTAGRAEVEFLFDDHPECAVYNGILSGPDSVYAGTPHFGIVAQSWRGLVSVKNSSSL